MRAACEQVAAPGRPGAVAGRAVPGQDAGAHAAGRPDRGHRQRQAWSRPPIASGTPAYGVGVGNAVHVVDETADVADAAAAIVTAKTFDYATSCLADSSVSSL